MTAAQTNKADITAYIGASGSGKSAAMKQRIAAEKPARLMVWDMQGEYAPLFKVRPLSRMADVHAALMRAGRGPMLICFDPSPDPDVAVKQFDAFCTLAYAAGPLWLLAEELSDVTQAAWAPAGWSVVSRKGRHKGLTVLGATQRPAAVDKHFFGNASRVRCGRLNYDADVKTMANVLRVPADEIGNLQPLEWIERDMSTGQTTRGKLEF